MKFYIDNLPVSLDPVDLITAQPFTRLYFLTTVSTQAC
jgi:hypothetical protein